MSKGMPRYGWTNEAGTLVPIHHEQQVIRFVDALIDAGRSSREIVKALNGAGFTNRTGGPFVQTQVMRMLKGRKRLDRLPGFIHE